MANPNHAERLASDIPDHIFFVATTKLEKIDQLNALAAQGNYPAIFMPITCLGEPAHSPDEESWDFTDNMLTKCGTAARFLNRFSREQTVAALKAMGFSKERIGRAKFFGCAEDSGIYFDEKKPVNGHRNFKELFFDTESRPLSDIDKEVIDGLRRFYRTDKSFPGTETVRIFGACGGIQNFFRLVDDAIAYAGLKVDPRAQSREQWLEILEESHLGTFAWNPGAVVNAEDLKKETFITSAECYMVYDGMPEIISDEATTYRHSVPLHYASKGDFRNRDILGEIYQPQSRGYACRKMMKEFGIAGLSGHLWREYDARRTYSLATSFMNAPYTVAFAPDDGVYLVHPRRAALAERLDDAGMRIHLGASPLDATRPTRAWEDMRSFQRLLSENDAFVLMPSATEALDRTRQLEHMLLLAYTAIHKQLDPEGKGKTIIIYDPNGDWEIPFHQMVTLFNRGVFGDRPSKFLKRVTTEDEVVDALKKARMSYRRVAVKEEVKLPVPDICAHTGRYNVGVFLSASLEGVYEDKAEHLGHLLQRNNMALVYGAADRNMMGGVYHGALRHEKETGEVVAITGSTTRVISTTECRDGNKPDKIADEFFYLAPDITERKDFFFKNSHAFICLEGGVGTLDELLTFMWFKENKPEGVKNKPMIISESAYAGSLIFQEALTVYFGKDYHALTPKEREEKGIIVLDAPKEKAPGDTRKLYEIELEAAMDYLRKHRAKHFPKLAASVSEPA